MLPNARAEGSVHPHGKPRLCLFAMGRSGGTSCPNDRAERYRSMQSRYRTRQTKIYLFAMGKSGGTCRPMMQSISLCDHVTERGASSKLSACAHQLPITNYQLPITNYQLPIINYQLPITNPQSPITNYQLPIPNSQLPIPNSQLPIPNYQSPITNLSSIIRSIYCCTYACIIFSMFLFSLESVSLCCKSGSVR